MAELILSKIAPPLDSDRISYEEAKAENLTIISDGPLPEVTAIEPKLIPGTWHVEMCKYGLSLGVIADGFPSEDAANAWAKQTYPWQPREDRYGGYTACSIYTPTAEDLTMLERAPKWLDLFAYVVKVEPNNCSPREDQSFELWASKSEALQRISALQRGGLNATLDGLMFLEYSRCVVDVKNRSKQLQSINGDVSKLADGSIWDTPKWRERSRRVDAQDWQRPESKSWDLRLFKDPQLRTFYSEFYSAKRLLATPVVLQGFPSEHAALMEGRRILATSKEFVAMSVWHSDAPSNHIRSSAHR